MVSARQAGGPAGRGVLRLTWNGARIAARIEAGVQQAMDQTANEAQADARSRARVDTGRMRAGIEAAVRTTGGGRRQIVLSGSAPYTIFHELGTSRITAQPMLRPAMDAAALKLRQRIRAILGAS